MGKSGGVNGDCGGPENRGERSVGAADLTSYQFIVENVKCVGIKPIEKIRRASFIFPAIPAFLCAFLDHLPRI